MKSVLHRSDTRGHADHGWLYARHSFSFANYQNRERMNFGVLRVLNDDIIAPSRGFGTHPHDNMEIITIPLSGSLAHKDSMGNGAVIKSGEVQVMSAGTGITHSEFNANDDKNVEVLQIWLYPNQKSVVPRYDQITIHNLADNNSFYQILSPNKEDQGVWIHQNAWFHIGNFDQSSQQIYPLHDISNGVYAFIIEGSATIEDQELNKRDAIGVWDTDKITILAKQNSKILLMEIPMTR